MIKLLTTFCQPLFYLARYYGPPAGFHRGWYPDSPIGSEPSGTMSIHRHLLIQSLKSLSPAKLHSEMLYRQVLDFSRGSEAQLVSPTQIVRAC